MTTPKTFSFHDFIPNTLFSLFGQNAVIIGVGGLGEVAAVSLAAADANIAVADFDKIKAKTVARKINSEGGRGLLKIPVPITSAIIISTAVNKPIRLFNFMITA